MAYNQFARTVVDPPDLKKIDDLAEQIILIAKDLEKANHRHGIHDAATLIRWLAFDAAQPGDSESFIAIKQLQEAIFRVRPAHP